MHQEVKDWKNHPITRNFEKGVQEGIDFFKKSLAEMDTDFDPKEVARKIGVIQGLEALLTYEPEIDENGNIIEEYPEEV